MAQKKEVQHSLWPCELRSCLLPTSTASVHVWHAAHPSELQLLPSCSFGTADGSTVADLTWSLVHVGHAAQAKSKRQLPQSRSFATDDGSTVADLTWSLVHVGHAAREMEPKLLLSCSLAIAKAAL